MNVGLKLTSTDLSILTLVASGVSPESHNLKKRLSGPDAEQVAEYLTEPHAKMYPPETVAIGEGFRRQFQNEKNFPVQNAAPEAAYESFP